MLITHELLPYLFGCIQPAQAFDSLRGTPEHGPTHTHTLCTHCVSYSCSLTYRRLWCALSVSDEPSHSPSNPPRPHPPPEQMLDCRLLLAWQCREGHKGEWELIEFAQLQPMGLQTILQDSPPHPHLHHTHTYTHIQLKSSQQLHTQFNQSLCLWKWAYVTSSVSVLSSLPASLSSYLSFGVSLWLKPFPAFLSVWHISSVPLLHVYLCELTKNTFFTQSFYKDHICAENTQKLLNKKRGGWQEMQLCSHSGNTRLDRQNCEVVFLEANMFMWRKGGIARSI